MTTDPDGGPRHTDFDGDPDPDPHADSHPDPRDDPDDAARLRIYAAVLADGIEAALAPWVVRSVVTVWERWQGEPSGPRRPGQVVSLGAAPATGDDVVGPAEVAGDACRSEIAPIVRRLLLSDIDEQRLNPLAIVRRGVRYPTEVLASLGVPPVERDAQARSQFPDDHYDLTPARFADLDPSLGEPGLVWGAAKAHVHLHRRRADGQR